MDNGYVFSKELLTKRLCMYFFSLSKGFESIEHAKKPGGVCVFVPRLGRTDVFASLGRVFIITCITATTRYNRPLVKRLKKMVHATH